MTTLVTYRPSKVNDQNCPFCVLTLRVKGMVSNITSQSTSYRNNRREGVLTANSFALILGTQVSWVTYDVRISDVSYLFDKVAEIPITPSRTCRFILNFFFLNNNKKCLQKHNNVSNIGSLSCHGKSHFL